MKSTSLSFTALIPGLPPALREAFGWSFMEKLNPIFAAPDSQGLEVSDVMVVKTLNSPELKGSCLYTYSMNVYSKEGLVTNEQIDAFLKNLKVGFESPKGYLFAEGLKFEAGVESWYRNGIISGNALSPFDCDTKKYAVTKEIEKAVAPNNPIARADLLKADKHASPHVNSNDSNMEAIRNGRSPKPKPGAHYMGLIATPPAQGFSPDKTRAFLLQVAIANAALLDKPLPEGHSVEARAEAVASACKRMDRPEFAAHVRPEVFPCLPVVKIDGPTDSFRVDLNGTPFARDGYASYSTERGSIAVQSVNLEEYRAFYEFTPQALAGGSIAPLDIEWTTTDGKMDKPEPEIRDHGLIIEALNAAKSDDLDRFDKLAAKSPGCVNSDGFSLSKALGEVGEEWAYRARERAIESGVIPAMGV
jgi:hypothetical protein